MLVEYVEDIGGNGNICLTNRKSTNFLSIYLHRYTLRLQRHWNLGRAGPRQILLFQIRPIFFELTIKFIFDLFSKFRHSSKIEAKASYRLWTVWFEANLFDGYETRQSVFS